MERTDWLPQLPKHWETKPLKYLASVNDEVLPETTFEEAEISYVEISDVSFGRGVTNSTLMQFGEAPSRARRMVKDGDLIVSTVRTYLKAIASVEQPNPGTVVSTGFAVLRPREINSAFLSHMFHHDGLIGEIISRSVGVSYPAISAGEIMSLDVPVPPLPEQRIIAAYLDRETARIDGLVERLERLIALLTEKRQAVISHAVTKGLDPSAHMKDSGIDWLGEVPAHWEVKPLKSLGDGRDGVFIDGDWIESKDMSEDGIRYITTGNVGRGVYREQGAGFIDDETFDRLNCTEVLPGDVLISRLNHPIGRACIVPNLDVRVVTSVDNVIVRPTGDVDRRFIVYLLSSAQHISNTANIARGTTMQRISRSALGNIRIVLPPVSEQAAIVDLLEAEIQELDEAETCNARMIALLKERRAALISAAVTGQIPLSEMGHAPAEAAE